MATATRIPSTAPAQQKPVVIQACTEVNNYLNATKLDNRIFAAPLTTSLLEDNKTHFYSSRERAILRVIYTIATAIIAAGAILLAAIFSPPNLPLAFVGVGILTPIWHKLIWIRFKEESNTHYVKAQESKAILERAHNDFSFLTLPQLEERVSQAYASMGIDMTQTEFVGERKRSLANALTAIHGSNTVEGYRHGLILLLAELSARENMVQVAQNFNEVAAETLQAQLHDASHTHAAHTILGMVMDPVAIHTTHFSSDTYANCVRKIKLAKLAFASVYPNSREAGVKFSDVFPYDVNYDNQIIIRQQGGKSEKVLSEQELNAAIAASDVSLSTSMMTTIAHLHQLPVLLPEGAPDSQVCFMQHIIREADEYRAHPNTYAASTQVYLSCIHKLREAKESFPSYFPDSGISFTEVFPYDVNDQNQIIFITAEEDQILSRHQLYDLATTAPSEGQNSLTLYLLRELSVKPRPGANRDVSRGEVEYCFMDYIRSRVDQIQATRVETA